MTIPHSYGGHLMSFHRVNVGDDDCYVATNTARLKVGILSVEKFLKDVDVVKLLFLKHLNYAQ